MKQTNQKKAQRAKASKVAPSHSPNPPSKAFSSGKQSATPQPQWTPSAAAASESTLRHLVYAAAPQFAEDSSGGGGGGGGGFQTNIYYRGQAVSGTTVDLKVGQLIELSVRSDHPGVPSAIQWDIPGIAIKSFTAKVNSGKVDPLTDGDKQRGVIKFCWVGGGVQNISAVLTFADGSQQTSASFDVKRPTSTLTASPGEITMNGSGMSPTSGDLGFRIDFSATKDLEGEVCWVQVGDSRRIWTLINDTQRIESYSGLDGEFPYPNTDGQGYRTNDGPSTPFDKIFKKLVVNDSFTMYWLYRPTSQDVWVPLKKTDWFWSAEIVKTGNASWEDWTFIEKQHSSSKQGEETSQHPEWHSHIPKNR